jgi:hypothetical protein
MLRFSGKKEDVQSKILKEMLMHTDDVLAKSIEHRILIGNDKKEYDIIAFSSSKDRKGYGYLISNMNNECRGLYVQDTIQLAETAQFARMAIPELFPSIADEDQESIFKRFIKTSLDAVIQDCDSSDYLWNLTFFK